ncbi:MAG: glycosyltransferase [Chloroflexi bacterium]|nr:glycosyltransferase [Chloroflexota bacterium]
MNILFVNYNDIDSNSGIHIANIANQLTRMGIYCVVCVPQNTQALRAEEFLFEVVDSDDLFRRQLGRKFDLVHVWTPREHARKITQKFLRFYPCPYIVHIEDNEEFLLETIFQIPFQALKRFPEPLLELFIQPYMSHPLQYRKFLEEANGITTIIDTLKGFCPGNVPTTTIWAGYQDDLEWHMPSNTGLKRSLGIDDDDFVVGYTGNVHRVNRQEIADLYLSINHLRSQGVRVKLVRTGRDYVSFLDWKNRLLKKEYSIELGYIPRSELPSVISIADVLVQPGKPNKFNDYRFPSKLPEYLASGKPVILPRTNIGLYLKNKEDCLFLDEGNYLDIAQKLRILFSDPALRNKIGSGGRKFAEQHLKWSDIAVKLRSFYVSLLDNNVNGTG